MALGVYKSDYKPDYNKTDGNRTVSRRGSRFTPVGSITEHPSKAIEFVSGGEEHLVAALPCGEKGIRHKTGAENSPED
jgi:hypothetical protein